MLPVRHCCCDRSTAICRFTTEFSPQRGGARVLAQLMRARGLAVEQNNNYVVSLSNNHTLAILDDDNNNGTSDPGESSTTVDVQLNYPDVTITKGTGQPDPTFLPRGTSLGNTALTVTNSAGARTISVNITGVVKIN